MHAHVVRHEIEDQTHIGVGSASLRRAERFLAAEFRIERVVIDDVVAMRACPRAP